MNKLLRNMLDQAHASVMLEIAADKSSAAQHGEATPTHAGGYASICLVCKRTMWNAAFRCRFCTDCSPSNHRMNLEQADMPGTSQSGDDGSTRPIVDVERMQQREVLDLAKLRYENSKAIFERAAINYARDSNAYVAACLDKTKPSQSDAAGEQK